MIPVMKMEIPFIEQNPVDLKLAQKCSHRIAYTLFTYVMNIHESGFNL